MQGTVKCRNQGSFKGQFRAFTKTSVKCCRIQILISEHMSHPSTKDGTSLTHQVSFKIPGSKDSEDLAVSRIEQRTNLFGIHHFQQFRNKESSIDRLYIALNFLI